MNASLRSHPVFRSLTPALPLVALLMVLTAPGAMAQAQPSTSPPALAETTAGPASLTYPLPEVVAVIPANIPTVRIQPESQPKADRDVIVPYTLGHCGLLSPIDLDGSLWQPASGTNAAGGPIASDNEIGELINATSGTLDFVDADKAMFTTPTGSSVTLMRVPDALDYPLCM